MEEYKKLLHGIVEDLKKRHGELNMVASVDNDYINRMHTMGRACGIAEALMIMIDKVKEDAPELIK